MQTGTGIRNYYDRIHFVDFFHVSGSGLKLII